MRKPWFSTARLITALLIATALADVVTRSLPVDALSFRAWEAMMYYRRPGTVFEPSRRYDKRSFGDLANMGNLPRHRVYRRETFTTDQLGFRNPPGLADSGKVRAILIGDSFSAGSGNPDRDTLSAQLTRLGVTTYNVAPMRLTAEGMQQMARRLKMDEGWVLYQQVTGLRYVYVEAAGVSSAAPANHQPVRFWERFERNLHTPTWPLRIAADQWLKSWQDDRWFPNSFKKNVEVRRLVNGDTMLFFPGESIDPVLPPLAHETIESTVDLYRGLTEQLKPTRLKLVVLLVPDRFSAYAHLMEKGAWTGGMSPYQAELDRRLREADVTVVNLYPAMAKAITEDAPRFAYHYWRDDTHWSGRGIRVAAREVAAFVTSHRGGDAPATASARP